MAEIVLYQYAGFTPDTTFSPPCGKVHLALRAKGIAYKVKNVSPLAVKRVNPRGRVPALSIDGAFTVDSTDILTELERRFPEPPLEPANPGDRARAKILEDWADEVLYFYLAWLRWGPEVGWARQRRVFDRVAPPLGWILPWAARREALSRFRGQGVGLKGEATVRRELNECLDAIEAMLVEAAALHDAAWLAGPRWSRADLAVCALVEQMSVRALTPEIADEVERRKALSAWLDRVHALAAPAC